MKQVTQRLRDGSITVLDVPPPAVTPETVLVDVRASLLSVGTERARTADAKKTLVGKARARPDDAKQVLQKLRRDGARETIQSVRMRLDQPTAIGYSSAGVVLEVGRRVRGIVVGDRVACGGGNRAVHADLNLVPANLCVPLPDEVPFDHGAFATVGSIALHGVRQADVRLGERVAVLGLGLVGQLSVQILRASGCTVMGIDLDEDLVEVARASGAVDFACTRAALGTQLPEALLDCDAVVITASTSSNDPIELAARLCRDRGRVVALGDVGMTVPRAAYYEKEIELRLSRSYGPGRYDAEYEERGLDYPIGYVRWTERRNMQAFVELAAAGRLDLDRLITRRVPIADAASAYQGLTEATRSPLGIIVQYDETQVVTSTQRTVGAARPMPAADPFSVGVIGAGSFAGRILIPGLRAAGFKLTAIASARGLSASSAAKQFAFERAVGTDELLADPALGLVAVATRHASHSDLATAALRAGKAVFVEKPPSVTLEGLSNLRAAHAETALPLAVGFNRRHAPLAVELRRHVRAPGGPIELLYRVNAGPLPRDHWLNDLEDGGGRLVGEGCHFVDLVCWVVGSCPSLVTAHLGSASEAANGAAQRFVVGMEFDDGSLATIVYGAGGASGLRKEYLEAHAGGRSAILDDYRTLDLHDGGKQRRLRRRGGDKGHAAQFVHLRRLVGGEAIDEEPSPLDTMLVTLTALRAAESGRSLNVDAGTGPY
jgi:predicted dehydrogenase/threonine dehydrogenase-like Zn-dependent dehydrogenase